MSDELVSDDDVIVVLPENELFIMRMGPALLMSMLPVDDTLAIVTPLPVV